MASLLQPAYSLTLGSQRWTEQLISLHVTLTAAPRVSVVRARLPIGAPMSAAIDDTAILTLDGGEGSAAVFSGAIAAIRRSFDAIEITALDAGGRLAQFRPAVTYEGITAGSLIRKLCDEVGVATGSIDDGVPLAYYVADPARSAWEHIARAAAWSGLLARVSADNAVEATVINAAEPELALRYGRELLWIEHAEHTAPTERFVVVGESGTGDTGSADAHRPTTDFFAGNRPDGPDATRRWRFEPALRTPAAAATAGAARDRSAKAQQTAGTFEAFLLPQLRPGTVFEIQDLPHDLGGPQWVESVRHQIDGRGARTQVRYARGGDSFDPLALLGSLLGAVGL
jgi:hypothetical protein